MKIIVLAGGLSTERDVSLSSSAGICRTLLEKGHDAFLLDVFMGFPYEKDRLEEVFTLPDHGLDIVKNISEEEPDLAAVKASRPDQSDCFLGPNVIELCRMADITFLGLHGGEGENGKLQATFDPVSYTHLNSLIMMPGSVKNSLAFFFVEFCGTFSKNLEIVGRRSSE